MIREGMEFGGISEIAGAILLIGVIASVIGVFGISYITSIQETSDIPYVVISQEYLNKSGSGYLVLTHQGGDTLIGPKTIIYVDGEDRTGDFTTASGGIWPFWSTGESLQLEIPQAPAGVLIVSYQDPENPTILWENGVVGVLATPRTPYPTFSPTTATPTPTTVTPTPTPSVPGDIHLDTDRPGYVVAGGYFEFISATGRIRVDNRNYDAFAEDVRIVFNSDQMVDLYLSGGRLSSLSADDITLYIGGSYVASGRARSANLNGYSDMVSTVNLVVPYEDGASTYLVADGVTIIDWWPTSDDEIRLYSLTPRTTFSPVGTLQIEMDSTSTYVISHVSTYAVIPHGADDPPVAQFSADVHFGEPPLTVQFTDRSVGVPSSWSWNFGDSQTSAIENPSHTYSFPGSYDVTLTATNAHGTDTKTETAFIVVGNGLDPKDTLLISSKNGYLQAGGFLEVVCMDSSGQVSVDGTVYNLAEGDIIRMALNSDDSTCDIYISEPSFWGGFGADDVNLYVNGEYIDNGDCTPSFSQYEDLYSTLQVVTDSRNRWTRFVVDGTTLYNGNTRDIITINRLIPDSSGVLNLGLSGNNVYYSGAISDYSIA